MAVQGKKLLSSINTAVNKLGEPAVLVPILEDLGRRHVDYGLRKEMYAQGGQALLDTLAFALEDAWTPEVKEAWTAVYGLIAFCMISGARAGHDAETLAKMGY